MTNNMVENMAKGMRMLAVFDTSFSPWLRLGGSPLRIILAPTSE